MPVPLVLLLAACQSTDLPLTDTERSDTEVSVEASEEAWREAVGVEAITVHLDALADIAAANDDTRVAGSEGYAASVAYVSEVLEQAGFTVELQTFTFSDWVFEDAALSVQDEALEFGDDFYVLTYSSAGSATGPLAAVDLELPPASTANSSTSGCESADFDDFPTGAVALIQRGSCTFADKAANAVAAGAVGVIIFNEGQSGRTDLFGGTLAATGSGVPVLSTTFAVGEALAEQLEAGEVTVSLSVDAEMAEIETDNVMATWPGTGEDEVVIGAHLDSVAAGPGINDNGSGTALVLAMAEGWAAMQPESVQSLRFAWWAAEEWGLLGSSEYVASLDEDGLEHTLANLNFDMVASPNPVRFVYDGDGSDTPSAGPTGSAVIEQLFTDWFDENELEWEATAFDGRSDYGPFIYADIPAGGLFSGAEGVKTAREAAAFGGAAEEAYDACYHQDCDGIDNIDSQVLGELAAASVHAAWTLATEPSPLAVGRRRPLPPPQSQPRELHGHCGHAPQEIR